MTIPDSAVECCHCSYYFISLPSSCESLAQEKEDLEEVLATFKQDIALSNKETVNKEMKILKKVVKNLEVRVVSSVPVCNVGSVMYTRVHIIAVPSNILTYTHTFGRRNSSRKGQNIKNIPTRRTKS